MDEVPHVCVTQPVTADTAVNATLAAQFSGRMKTVSGFSYGTFYIVGVDDGKRSWIGNTTEVNVDDGEDFIANWQGTMRLDAGSTYTFAILRQKRQSNFVTDYWKCWMTVEFSRP